MVLFARLSDAPGASGIGAIYVPQNTPGIQFGSPETLMGFRGIPSADIAFDNVQVPKENLLVPPGSFGKLMSVFNLERCGNATMSFSQAQASLDVHLPFLSSPSSSFLSRHPSSHPGLLCNRMWSSTLRKDSSLGRS